MLMAFNRASDLLRAGQTSTQIPQPVQSSTATCSVYFNPFHSGNRASADLNDEGAPWRTAASYTLLRMTACGQTITHLPHWIQTCWIPDRHFAREISLLELRRAGRIRAVVRQRAHRDAIAATRHDFAQHIAHKLRRALELSVADRTATGNNSRPEFSLRTNAQAFDRPPADSSPRSRRLSSRTFCEWNS